MRGRLALGALAAAALALRLVHLARFELFVDEAATWWFARLTAAGRLGEQIALEPTPPLYYALVGGLMRAFGESDAVMRLPSALFGAAAVPAVYWLGASLCDRRTGWIAAILLSVHPLHVFYSREARVYPLLLLLAILLLLTLWKALEDASWRRWTAFGAVLLLACYSHFYGLFLVATSALAIALLSPDRRTLARGLAAAAAAALLFAPYLLATLPHLRESGAAWSIETFYRDLPEEKRLGRVLEQQLVGADHHAYLRQLDRPPTPAGLRAASVLAQCLLLAAALAGGWVGPAAGSRRRRVLALLAVGWLVPILLPWGITHGWRAIFHSGRHDVYTLGAVTVLLAAGLSAALDGWRSRWWPRLWVVATVAVLVTAVGFRLYWLHRTPAPDASRAAGAWIAAHTGPRDRVIATGIRRLVSEHYTRLRGGEVPFESFPASTDDHPGWSDVMTLIEDPEALHDEARRRVAELTAGGVDQIALLLRTYRKTGDAVSATWLVDRHLVENLWAAGWRAWTPPAAAELGIAVYRPPGSVPDGRRPEEGRGHPAEYLTELEDDTP